MSITREDFLRRAALVIRTAIQSSSTASSVWEKAVATAAETMAVIAESNGMQWDGQEPTAPRFVILRKDHRLPLRVPESQVGAYVDDGWYPEELLDDEPADDPEDEPAHVRVTRTTPAGTTYSMCEEGPVSPEARAAIETVVDAVAAMDPGDDGGAQEEALARVRRKVRCRSSGAALRDRVAYALGQAIFHAGEHQRRNLRELLADLESSRSLEDLLDAAEERRRTTRLGGRIDKITIRFDAGVTVDPGSEECSLFTARTSTRDPVREVLRRALESALEGRR